MKTFTTLTAVAALIAGISIASAQSTMSPSAGSSSGTAGTSGAAGSSQQATGSGRYCIEATPGGALNCKYASLSACQKDAKVQGQNCAPNPNSGTTGSKQ